ncbi:MAG: prevent-host-death family protein [Clostridiaceae bacterium BRH_c20a]|nr:MAG: prevent-host-death family protein [Clostridiaceae bacterium BRH_c20a]
MDKPTFSKEQIISSTDVAKKFGEARRKAKSNPIFITEKGNVDTVLLNYDYFEQMYSRLVELEKKAEEQILLDRIERLEKNPEKAISWRKLRKE